MMMEENPKKKMLIGSVSVASIIILVAGSMAPSLLFTATPDNIEKIYSELKWDIIVPDNYPTLYQAIENAEPGDNIFVRSGRYYSGSGNVFSNALNIRKSGLTIAGENKNNTYIDGRKLSSVMYIYADDVKISGLNFVNNGVNGSLLYVYSKNCVIDDNIFKIYNDYEGIEYGVNFYNADASVFSNNQVSNGEYGLRVFNSDYCVFSNNVFEKNGYAVTVSNMINFNLSNSWADSISIDGSDNNVFSNNTVKNNRDGFSFTDSDNNLVFNNTFISNNKDGLVLNSCENNVIESNEFVADGIDLSGNVVEYYIHTIKNNTVNGKPIYYLYNVYDYDVPSDAGQIIIVDCRGITIEGVIISDTSTAVLVVFSSQIYIRNSEFSHNSRGVYLYLSSSCYIQSNNFIKNRLNAGFVTRGFMVSRTNYWRRNYWEKTLDLKPGIFKGLPQKITGRFFLKRTARNPEAFHLGILTISYDKRPVRNPYSFE